MFLQIILLIVGFVLLIKGADFLVEGASGVAKKFGVSTALIGLTIVAFGTSAPEISVAFQSFAAGTTDLTLGDIVGCGVSNILLLLGVGAIIRPIAIQKRTLKIEIPFYLLVAGVFVALACFGEGEMISRLEAVVLLVFFGAFLAYTFWLAKQKTKVTRAEREEIKKAKKRFWVNLLWVVLGLVGVIFGSDMVINSATEIATTLGVSEKIIAMTAIAIGTSLPELITTITASRKNEQDLMVGNIIGSNIFNFCLVLGLPTVIYGSLSTASLGIFEIVAMMTAAVLLYVIGLTGKKITRAEGVLMLSLFVLYFAKLIIWT